MAWLNGLCYVLVMVTTGRHLQESIVKGDVQGQSVDVQLGVQVCSAEKRMGLHDLDVAHHYLRWGLGSEFSETPCLEKVES